MKLIKPSFEIYEQGPGLEGIYEAIERAGRTCYKSKRPEGQIAKDFVDRMIKLGHGAILEHGTVYLTIQGVTKPIVGPSNIGKYLENPYSKVAFGEGTTFYITTNYRVLIENGWLDDLQYLCEPTEFHEKRVTVRFTTDIGISREFNRHRVNSPAEQSTRYCNFSKDKFSNEISVILPDELSDPELELWLEDCTENRLKELAEEILDNSIGWGVLQNWLFANLACEYSYMNLIRLGWKPQQARRVLPLDLCTELVHTAFVSDWDHFFSLRAKGTTGAPHPDAKALAEPLMQEFIKRNLITQ